MTKKRFNWQQAQWSEFLTRFDYKIVYQPGKSNGKADASTRRPGDLPEGGDERLKYMRQAVLKPHNLPEQLRISTNDIPIQQSPSISDLFVQAYKDDLLPNKILETIRHGDTLREITVAECTEQDGQVRYRGKRYGSKVDHSRL
jgi:hypothetical protein